MSATSTYMEVKRRLRDLLTTAFAGQPVTVTWSWDPSLSDRAVFLSRPFFIDDSDRDRSSIDLEFANLVSGRKARNETYTVPISVARFLGEISTTAAETADDGVWDLAGVVENLLAEDPKLGLTSIQWALLSGIDREQYIRTVLDVEGRPIPVGWVVVLVLLVEVQARLT